MIAPGPLRVDLEARFARGWRIRKPARRVQLPHHRGVPDASPRPRESRADDLRAFLAELSLTGIPQPSTTCSPTRRRDSAPCASARARRGAYVRSTDPALLRQLAVDQALTTLALEPDGGDRLATRVRSRSAVTRRCGMPGTPSSPKTPPVASRRSRGAVRRPVGGVVSDDTAALVIARVRESAAAAPDEGDRAWLARQLELAVKGG